MEEYESSVSPKGQITLPVEVRRRWRLKPKDRVAILVDGQTVRLAPARSLLDESFGAVPPLKQPLSDKEMTRIAAEEHAREAAREGAADR